MPYKARLTQAIRDENARLSQQQMFLVLGPGVIILAFVAVTGWLAVHFVRAPELFGGGLFEPIGYGVLSVVILLSLTKGYAYDKWLEAWLQLGIAHSAKVAKIEAVMAKLERDEQEKAELTRIADVPQQPSDPWMRALASATPQDAATTPLPNPLNGAP